MKPPAENPRLRNIAIIAHVDHGKTTLVDQLLSQSGTLRPIGGEQAERVMDNMDLERERGITIAAKNCSLRWKDVKINIVDTPGHSDFGGEVERALSMVDGAVLLVDSSEGPLPQTRFVLKKALARKLAIVVVVNKIDRKDARPKEVLNAVYDLFIDLGADESQIDFPVVYAIGRDGIAQATLETPGKDLSYLFDTIVKTVPPPRHDPVEPFQMLVSNLAYSEFLGRLAVGKVIHGTAKKNDQLLCMQKDGEKALRTTKLQVYEGVRFAEVDVVEPGEVIILAGVENVEIGDTICTKNAPKRQPRITVDEPTISMKFCANTGPYSGTEGKIVQPQKIGERLRREALNNIAIVVEMTPGEESYIVKGRGEFQMAILIEMMRREGFELCVGRPQIIYKEKDGVRLEPVEHLFIDCDEAFIGVVTEKLARRKGRMTNMINHGTGRVQLEFSIPSRGLIGYRNEFLTDTRGTGIMNSSLEGYEEYRGDFVARLTGSLVADRLGEAVPYAIFHLEPRGTMFVQPGDKVYEGMIIGEHTRDNDLDVNVCKTKKLTNIRAAGRDENVILTPVTPLTIERAIEFIRDDEMVEVTPQSIRLRKMILPANQRG